jgi:hypothetical protein
MATELRISAGETNQPPSVTARPVAALGFAFRIKEEFSVGASLVDARVLVRTTQVRGPRNQALRSRGVGATNVIWSEHLHRVDVTAVVVREATAL